MAAFGTVFTNEMILSRFENNSWSQPAVVATDSISLHPGAHVLHYASTCFEGMKAFRHADDSVHIFRMDKNVARLQQSSELLALPQIDAAMLSSMITEIVRRYAADVPMPPGSMYIRPTHIGTEASIGKAAAPSLSSLLYVLLSPVGDYFAGGAKALRLLLGRQCPLRIAYGYGEKRW
ncbi:branched chain amino acid aminotransferase [Alishewanella longhuensis]